jgi:drug/metabolite transporter (DMT)-like permease
MSKNFKGALAALTANTIFGFSFLFSKVALSVASPIITIAVRFTVAAVIMALLWCFGIIKLNFKNKPMLKLVLMAVAQPLLYFILEVYGINATSSALSGVIISLVPVAVIALSSLFLKEKPTLRQLLFSFLSLISVIVISLVSESGGNSSLIGISLLVGAVICAAVFNILSRDVSSNFSPSEKTFVMFIIGAVGFNIIALLTHRGEFASELLKATTDLSFWGSIAYLSVVSSIGAFMLYNYATANISVVRAASFANITTVVSLFAGILILKETLSPIELVCSALIILGVWGVNMKGREKDG